MKISEKENKLSLSDAFKSLEFLREELSSLVVGDIIKNHDSYARISGMISKIRLAIYKHLDDVTKGVEDTDGNN